MSSEPAPASTLRDQPFWLLRVHPGATQTEVDDAFELAKREPYAVHEDLALARDIIIDPDLRLPFELNYPLGYSISELDEWQRLLSPDVQCAEQVEYSEHLSPLGRSNFLAFVAAHRAAEAELLCAMIDAQSRIEPTEVYEQLKEARRIAGYQAPSLASVRKAIESQPGIQWQACISAYPTIDEAAEAVFECIEQLLSSRVSRHIEFLTYLLLAYREPALEAQALRTQDIVDICDELDDNARAENLVGDLDSALHRWMVLARPLLLANDQATALDEACQALGARLRLLVIDLALAGRHDTAIKIAELGKHRLSLLPRLAAILDEAVTPARRSLQSAKARKLSELRSLVAKFAIDPDALIATVQQGGFGPDSSGAARRLREAFLEATKNDLEFLEPWTEMRGLAKHLARQPGNRSAAAKLMRGLRNHAVQISAPSYMLRTLEDDLRQLMQHATQARSRGRRLRNSIWIFGPIALVSGFGLTLLLLKLERPRLLIVDTFARSLPFPSMPATRHAAKDQQVDEQTRTRSDGKSDGGDGQTKSEETLPQVGTGQRLPLNELRYCRFQEERLRLIKPRVQSADDTRAFNLLAVDYNSRCSDFLYRDVDAAIVAAELDSNRERLGNEADKIVASWPGHAATSPAVK